MMKNFMVLSDALEYIEVNLQNDVTQEEIARACACSLSSLQKLFSYCFHLGIAEYITKRRMTNSARELIAGESVINTAFNFGYGSPEAFTRAFTRAWGISPSEFRKSRKFTDFFPRYEFNYKEGAQIMKKVDISELYDLLKKMRGSYVAVFDVVGLMRVNKEQGRDLGDAVIMECLRRIEDGAGDDMFMFRIGGDEFALVTGATEPADVETIVGEILAHNGETVSCGGNSTEVSMRAGAIKLEKSNLRYSELYTDLTAAITAARECDGMFAFAN